MPSSLHPRLAAILAGTLLVIGLGQQLHAASQDCGWNSPKDLGWYYTRNWASDDATGWVCTYWDGDITWWTTQFNNTRGEFFPTIGKGTIGGSPGYPKRIDSTGAIWVNATAVIKDWGGLYNGSAWGFGVTLWIDESNPTTWPFTHEIMIFETHRNLDAAHWATTLGTVNTAGSNYKVYCWKNYQVSNGTIRSYSIQRVNQRSGGGWLNIKDITNWLRSSARGEWQIPNNYIDHIVWGVDGMANGSGSCTGEFSLHSISVPNL